MRQPKKEKPDIEPLLKKYNEAREKALSENRQYAIRIADEANEDITIKYRLVLRPTPRGIIHMLEIMDATEERGAVQIALTGNWEAVLAHAERVFAAMSLEKYKEVMELLIRLREHIRGTGGRVQEVE